MPDKNAPSTAPEESQVAVTNDEEVAAAAQELDDLRAQIQQKRDDRLRREQGLSHEVHMSELDVEKARLLAELAEEERLDHKSDGASDATFATAEEAMKAALVRAKAAEDATKIEDEARKNATDADRDSNAQLTGTPVPDGGQPSVVAKSVAPTAKAAAASTGKGK